MRPIASPFSSPSSGSTTPRPVQARPQPSGLSLLRPTPSSLSSASPSLPSPSPPPSSASSTPTLTPKSPNVVSTETTPLLSSSTPPGGSTSSPTRKGYSSPATPTPLLSSLLRRRQPAISVSPTKVKNLLRNGVKSLPAVLLGSLLNVLDGVSYGMIIFPATGVFADLGPMGVSMFFVSTVLAQLAYTCGGSEFAGANGSMMIEVVPFFHILATSIARQIGEDHPKEVIATTLAAYALSSVLTGLSFLLLGALKLGVIIGFFPRHILVGCIGGVGAFLIETALTISLRITDDDFTMTWETFKFVFGNSHSLALWVIPLALAVLLRIISSRIKHQLVFPMYFMVIPTIFYIVVAAAQLNLPSLREAGWVFDMGPGEHEVWNKFYSYFDLGAVQFAPLWTTLPTQFALLFFNILHPPLNVPALAVSLNTDVDTNRELVSHGYSNLLAGIFGTVPNYLVYVNTLLFYRVGGGTRIAGFLLAVATALLLFIGTGPIAYIPVMVVGALIFVLGIDLVKEALWDTRHRVSRQVFFTPPTRNLLSKTEYITIICIMICMTVWDFVIGVLFGIIISCFVFVVQNSQRRSIRALYTGETAMSTVRRPSLQRAYIREVSKQTTILRLQGFLFFGTITYVEETIRGIIDGSSWQRNPVRFLILDLSLVAGVDMSSAEAFVRVQRLLSGKGVTLVFCGFLAESSVGKALECVEVLGADGVELFSTLNDALEWTENAYLRAWLRSQKSESLNSPLDMTLPGRHDDDIGYQQMNSLACSPRLSQIRNAGNMTLANEPRPQLESGHTIEPYNTLVKAFSSYGDVNYEEFRPLETYLQRMSVPAGMVMWTQGEPSDGLYIIQSGVLRAQYRFSEYTPNIEESMVAGTVAGELSALSGLPRNATVIVEHPAVLWKLTLEKLRQLNTDEPELSRTFQQLVLKAAKMDYDILLSALASRQ
ncbi:sulfate transporter family-domain-containing protein [Infundibulicybe gibba]|nr:sulfate transporter family-domain-containing protein [Infundibulicybe gibba]